MGIEFTEREKKIIVHGLQLFMSHAAQYEGVVTEPERKELFRGGHEDAKALIQKVTADVVASRSETFSGETPMEGKDPK
jgi:hypothetical protein